MARYFLLLGACLLAAADALVVGGGSLATARQAASSRPLARTIRMESQEDREFKEWARNKKIAAGVDPDEDFAAGREAESKIYVVGGAPCRLPAHLHQTLSVMSAVWRFADLRALVCALRRAHHSARAADRRNLGVQRGLPDSPVSSAAQER